MTSPATAKLRGVLKIPTNEKNQTQGLQYPAEPRDPAENQTQQGQNKTGGSQSVRASPLLLIDNDRPPFDLTFADFISILLRNIIHKI